MSCHKWSHLCVTKDESFLTHKHQNRSTFKHPNFFVTLHLQNTTCRSSVLCVWFSTNNKHVHSHFMTTGLHFGVNYKEHLPRILPKWRNFRISVYFASQTIWTKCPGWASFWLPNTRNWYWNWSWNMTGWLWIICPMLHTIYFHHHWENWLCLSVNKWMTTYWRP